MAQSTITVYKCDRCNTVAEIRKVEDSYGWGKTVYFQYNGPKYNRSILSKSNVPEPDVCPDCLKQLHEWWTRDKEKL